MTDAEKIHTRAATWIGQNCPEEPEIALVLGSGLGDWIPEEAICQRIAYADIPGFPLSTVQGHAGALLVARIHNTPIFVLSGRFHLYEGYHAQEVARPIICLGLLGVRTLILTNAAGALNPLFTTGGLMLLTDHINMTGHNPLRGPNVEAFGPRFPDMTDVYCPQLREMALQTAQKQGQRLEQGVYVGVMGPSLETAAETRMYRRLGADAIGMSTVTEAIVARHMGIRTLGISCLTNKNLPDCMVPTSQEEILNQAAMSATALGELLGAVIPRLPTS